MILKKKKQARCLQCGGLKVAPTEALEHAISRYPNNLLRWSIPVSLIYSCRFPRIN